MKNSLKNQLTISLISLLLCTAIVNAVVNFYDVMRETLELQDHMLAQVANYIDPKSSFHNQDLTEQADLYIQTSATISNDLLVIDPTMAQGFYDFQQGENSYRYYLRLTQEGYVLVMQSNTYRTTLALDVAIDNAIPFLILMPLLSFVMIYFIRYKMRPIEQLSDEIQQRQDFDLTQIQAQVAPTEIQGFITAINKLLQRTEDLIQQQQRFIADAAHELRSPMTALSLQAERLLKQPLSNEQLKQLSQLQQSIQRQRHLTEQLLSLARSQATTQQEFKSFPLQNLVRQVINDLLPLAQAKQQDLGCVSEQHVCFYGNEIEIYTLLKTLVDNAITYTPLASQIDIGYQQTEQQIILWVEDNGLGIAEEQRQRVLEPFYRILGTKQQGSGLGLAIAQAITKRYKGKLQLLPSTTFTSGLLVKVSFDKQK